ncbi:hypothetical protein CKO44_15655 [Rubrivivax gelatinosus]|uniref:Uncharacterized protein n=1 Tax=Rubrivivax gelatinosus TaxID=28068 RepID=A0ABS1DXR0_RUBGE|nr:hypothetical protein [Rubrivivax gelatinosus]MBK1614905.1 hypothetical protein [Rubrivivax gelatinosus]MBK1713520.1 hypothetical protein [Rubrivivax gelatinosus]
MNQLVSLQTACDLIRTGAALCVAGTDAALRALPPGRWIGGSIPYFMLNQGGTVSDAQHVFVTDLAPLGEVSFASYGADELAGIAGHAPDNGVSITIIPGGSRAHQRFAAEAASYEDAFVKPTVGWIAGCHVSEIGSVRPTVYEGSTGTRHEDRAVVAYLKLPADKLACIDIVNLFEPDDGDVLRFDDTSFEVETCRVNGERVNFASYLRSRGLEHGQLPLVGDFAGARINASLQRVPAAGGLVQLYAPVFPGVDYRVARPIADYAEAFRSRLAAQDLDGAVLACNCVLNFLFGELEGKAIGGVQGPATFGEIAYQLLNQTMVVLRVV